MEQYEDWNPVNLEAQYISPGLVDLNTRIDFESLASLTRSAALGGVTLLLDEEDETTNEAEDLYVDVGKVKIVVDSYDSGSWEQAMAVKCYLFPPNSNVPSTSNIEEVVYEARRLDKLLIVDPLLPEDRMMHMASPLRSSSPDKRLLEAIDTDTSVLAAAFPTALEGSSEDEDDTQGSDFMPEFPLKVRTTKPKSKVFTVNSNGRSSIERPYYRPDHNIFTDLQKRVRENEASIQFLSKVEQETYGKSGSTLFSSTATKPQAIAQELFTTTTKPSPRLASFRPKPVEVAKKAVSSIQKLSESEFQYMYYLANFPDHWEVTGITKVFATLQRTPCRLHFANLSSATAVNKVLVNKASLSVTCETAPHFMYYTDEDVARGNTRLKTCPPIRNNANCNLLWDMLKMKGIDCISSHHRAIPLTYKDLDKGSFSRAMPGIPGLGVSLQLVWTRLRRPCTSLFEIEHYIVRLSKWMSLKPAQILGVSQHYGSIEPGKFANLIIWNPHETFEVPETCAAFPDTFPYTGATLYGPISKVMLRGSFIVSDGVLTAKGRITTQSELEGGRDRD